MIPRMGEGYLRTEFPLDLTCPVCSNTPVRFTVTHHRGIQDLVDVEVACVCGHTINYGSLPATFAHPGEDDND